MTGKHIGILKSPEVFRKDDVLVFSTKAKENLGKNQYSSLSTIDKELPAHNTRKELAKVRRCSGKIFYQYQF